MFISPKHAISQGWIQGQIEDKHIQPNAIDFTADRLFSINWVDTFILSEQEKVMRGSREVQIDMERNGIQYWRLNPNSVYDVMSNMFVTVPEGVAALMIVRSTLNRNGLFITNGLYDSGFSGNIGVALHNRSGEAFIAPGTRIGQIYFVESDSVGKYAGGYNGAVGEHWTETKGN